LGTIFHTSPPRFPIKGGMEECLELVLEISGIKEQISDFNYELMEGNLIIILPMELIIVPNYLPYKTLLLSD